MKDDLKPCPFCGEPAELDTRESFRAFSDGRMLEQVSASCTSCSATISQYPGDIDCDREQTTEIVVEAWNRRPEPVADDAVDTEKESLKARVCFLEQALAEREKDVASLRARAAIAALRDDDDDDDDDTSIEFCAEIK